MLNDAVSVVLVLIHLLAWMLQAYTPARYESTFLLLPPWVPQAVTVSCDWGVGLHKTEGQ